MFNKLSQNFSSERRTPFCPTEIAGNSVVHLSFGFNAFLAHEIQYFHNAGSSASSPVLNGQPAALLSVPVGAVRCPIYHFGPPCIMPSACNPKFLQIHVKTSFMG